MSGRKSPLSSEPTTPTMKSNAYFDPNNDDVNYGPVNPLFNPTPKLPEPFESPLSSEPTTPRGKSNAFINPNEAEILRNNPLLKHTRNLQKPPKSPLSKQPTTPTVKSNASYNPNKLNLNPNPNPVTFHSKLPEDFLKAMEKHGKLVKAAGNPTMGAGRRRTKYKRAKKRSFKSRKKLR